MLKLNHLLKIDIVIQMNMVDKHTLGVLDNFNHLENINLEFDHEYINKIVSYHENTLNQVVVDMVVDKI